MSSTLGWTVGLLIVFSALAVLVVIGRRLGLARQVIVSATVFVFIALIVKLFFGLTGDENAYQSAALALIENWRTREDLTPNLPWTKLSVSFVLASVYHISIASPYLGVLALTPFYSAIPLLIGQASFNFFDSVKSRNLSAWAAVLRLLPESRHLSGEVLTSLEGCCYASSKVLCRFQS